MYLQQMSKDPSGYDYADLIGLCIDLFEAGGETVGSTLSWVLMYLALYRDVQEKCFQEIHSILGEDFQDVTQILV